MKRFIYTIAETKHERATGYRNQTAEVYHVKRNVLHWIGTIKWNTGGYRGQTGEVKEFLVRNKHIPKSWTKLRGDAHKFSLQCI